MHCARRSINLKLLRERLTVHGFRENVKLAKSHVIAAKENFNKHVKGFQSASGLKIGFDKSVQLYEGWDS